MNFPKILYQLNSSDKIKKWGIDVVDQGTNSAIIITSGQLEGKLVTNIAIVSEGKNLGKSNETNHYTQALAEAESKVETQLKKGYVEDITKVKSSKVLGSGLPAPMLAQKHCPDGSQASSKTLAQLKLVGKEVFVQPKLDGNRCLIRDGKMYTRTGDLMPVQLDHILNEFSGVPSSEILDGELFSFDLPFNVLNGLIKRETVTPEEKEQRKLIKFHIYDVMQPLGYEKRYEYIKSIANKAIHTIFVPAYKIVATDENIKKYLEDFLAKGHEGLMIRQLYIGYENKRTWQLCKVKVFEDEEFKLVNFEEDVRGGFVGAFVLQNNATADTFNAGASGQSVEDRTEMWNNKNKYLGRQATVQFFGKSEYGIPRFPKFKGFV